MQLRRLSSFAIDVLVIFGPWTSIVGLFLGGGSSGALGLLFVLMALCALASIVLLVVQAVLFVRGGRTLGMACVGLVAVTGSRWRSLILGVTTLLLPVAVAALVALAPIGGEAQELLLIASPFPGIALELLSALAPDARTLSDRMAGIIWARETGAVPWASDMQPLSTNRRALAVDGLALAMVGAPMILVVAFQWVDVSGIAASTAVMIGLFVAFEAIALKRTRGTLAMIALALPAARPQAR